MMKDVQGFENLYAVTDEGRVFSKKKNRLLSAYNKEGWYVNIKLCKNGIQYPFKVHRLIANAFLPNPNNLKDVNHKNGIKYDNRVDNLEWISRSENQKHAYRELGRVPVTGSSHPKSKFVLDYQTGIFYECAREAAEAKGINKEDLLNNIRQRKVLKRRAPFKFGLSFV